MNGKTPSFSPTSKASHAGDSIPQTPKHGTGVGSGDRLGSVDRYFNYHGQPIAVYEGRTMIDGYLQAKYPIRFWLLRLLVKPIGRSRREDLPPPTLYGR